MNTLLYAMGGESEDIFISFTFAPGADQSNYDHVKEKFDHNFNDNNNNVLGYYASKNLNAFTKILYTCCNCQRH